MSQTCPKPLSTEPEAERKRKYRDAVKRVEVLEAEVSALRSKESAFQTVVEEFTKLNEGLRLKQSEMESTGQAVALGQRVLADPDLRYLVESMYLRSETQRTQLRKQIEGYRRSMK